MDSISDSDSEDIGSIPIGTTKDRVREECESGGKAQSLRSRTHSDSDLTLTLTLGTHSASTALTLILPLTR